jgi:hypothetical protein
MPVILATLEAEIEIMVSGQLISMGYVCEGVKLVI